jgi:citrate synthase
MLYSLPKTALPMEVLRTSVSMLSSFDLRPDATARDAVLDKGIFVTSRLPTIAFAFNNLRNGRTPFHPRKDLTHAGNLLFMLRGTPPDQDEEKIMDAALIVHADHEYNASTFAARVTVGTLSDYYSAVTSAIGTLKGPLHGGANQDVMNMLLHIGEMENVESYIHNQFANKKKIPGFGHRVYKLEDPRAQFLRTFAYQLGEKKNMGKWAAMTKQIQDIVQTEKSIYPNVDLYSASVYYALGIPVDMFTCIFTMSRIAGWTAHIIEQYQNNRLIRPASKYIGKMGMKYTPISERT